MKPKNDVKKRMTLAVMAALLAASLVCGCSDGKSGKVSHGQTKAVSETSTGQVSDGSEENGKESDKTDATEKRTVQSEIPEENTGVTLDVGVDSPFGGIAVETDENGELVYTEEDGEIRYLITDSRFGTYRKFSRFAKDHMKTKKATAFLTEANRCFITIGGKLYFVDGASGRTVDTSKRYVMDGGAKIRVMAEHTEESVKKYHVTRSVTEFVKVDGAWKLSKIHYS